MFFIGPSEGIIHLVRTQNFSKNEHFLPPDIYTYVCVSGDKIIHDGAFLRTFCENSERIFDINYFCENISS